MRGYLNLARGNRGHDRFRRVVALRHIGYADDDGYFYIVDRVKELIKYKGYQVAPAEAVGASGFVDAAVVGSPDGEAGEVPKAFLVLRSEDAQVEDVLAFVAARLAPYTRSPLGNRLPDPQGRFEEDPAAAVSGARARTNRRASDPMTDGETI